MRKYWTPGVRLVCLSLAVLLGLYLGFDYVYARTLGKHPDGDCVNPEHLRHPASWHY